MTEKSAPCNKRGPEAGLADSEIMTLLVLYRSSPLKNFKTFMRGSSSSAAPGLSKAPCYARFIALTSHVWVPLTVFPFSHMGRRSGLRHIDSTAPAVCHNRRSNQHKVFADPAARGKTSIGWFFGFKLHLVCNHERQIGALKLTPGHVNDTTPVPDLTQDLIGNLVGDKGYVGKGPAQRPLRHGLALMTRLRRNMTQLPVSCLDKPLLNGRNIVETIIGHIKEVSSLRLAEHQSVSNAFTHITAAVVACQIKPPYQSQSKRLSCEKP